MTADLQFFEEAKQFGALRHLDDVRTREINQQAGGSDKIIAVMCGDCDHSDDKISQLSRIFPGIKRHLHTWNGGGLILDACSPANQLGMDCSPFAQFQVMQSLVAKPDIVQVLVEVHFPCAIARLAHMSLRDAVRSLIHTKELLKHRALHELGRHIHVGLLVHRYRPDVEETEARRMYYLPSGMMQQFLVRPSEAFNTPLLTA